MRMAGLFWGSLLVLFVATSRRDQLCQGKADVLLVIDESSSVGKSDFYNHVLPFAHDFSHHFEISEEKTHVGVIKYTSVKKSFVKKEYCIGVTVGTYIPQVTVVHPLDGKKEKLFFDIDHTSYLGGWTPTGHALEVARQEFATSGRGDAFKFVVLVTDGNPTCDVKGGRVEEDPTYAYDRAEALKSETGALLIVVEVGAETKRKVNEKIASKEQGAENDPYVYTATDYSKLTHVIDILLAETCVDVTKIDLSTECVNAKMIDFHVIGTGLKDLDGVGCRLFEHGNETLDQPSRTHDLPGDFVNDHLITCQSKNLSLVAGTYTLEVSMNGILYFGGKSFDLKYCDDGGDEVIPFIGPLQENSSNLWWFLLLIPLGLCYLCPLLYLPLLCFYILPSIQVSEKLQRVRVNESELKDPLIEQPDEPDIDMEADMEEFAPPPGNQNAMYFVGGKAVPVNWGKKGLGTDTPYRGSDMGMGENYKAK